MSDRDKRALELVIALRFKKAVPFPPSELTDPLNNSGFDIDEGSPVPIHAMKNGFEFLYSPDDSIINLKMDSYEEIEEGYNMVRTIIFEEMGIEDNELEAAGITSKLVVWNGESTYPTFSKFYPSIELPDPLGEGVPSSVRLVSEQDFDPGGSDMFDVKVEPFVRNSDYYYLEFGYRKPMFDALNEVVEDFTSIVDGIIDTIEEEGSSDE